MVELIKDNFSPMVGQAGPIFQDSIVSELGWVCPFIGGSRWADRPVLISTLSSLVMSLLHQRSDSSTGND